MPSTSSVALANAARRPERSSAWSPRAVIPPGEVTSRRTVSVSMERARRSAAEPLSEAPTSSAAGSGGSPWRIAASIQASAIRAT